MGVARYRSPVAIPARVGLTIVMLRPLSKAAIDEAVAKAEIPWRLRNIDPDVNLGEAAKQLAIVEAATGEPISKWVGWGEASRLFDRWLKAQERSMPDVDALSAELELQIADGEGDGVSDVVTAAACDSPQSFYGRAVADLTEGQLAYYLTCRGVHERVYGGESGRKSCVSRKALERRAGRSASSNRARAVSR